MGRKIKNILVLVFVIGLLYWQQSAIMKAADTEEDMLESGDRILQTQEPEDETGEKEDGNNEECPDEAEDGEKEGEPTNEGDKEKIECFQTVIPTEDGENGYYVTKPEVEICHISKRGITKYCFIDSNGQATEGELKHSDEKVRIEKEKFREGINELSIWMEDEEGQRVEEYTLEKTFLIDTIAPVIQIQTPQGTETWYQKEVLINVSGEDGNQGSQIDSILCFSGNKLIGESHQVNTGFLITLMSEKGNAVPVTIRMRDKAGNYAEKTMGLYIDHEPPRTSIEGIQNYMITSQSVEVNYLVDEENLIGQANAEAKREDPQGKVTIIKAQDWKETETGIGVHQILTEDGIYQLGVNACDKAGYEGSSAMQIIIDKENPVIGFVDEIDSKYLQSFCWNYPIEEWIQDFTSYTYSIMLDGKPYHMGEEVTEEGRHVLEVKATDSAGNIGTAKAQFVIDHTPPQIIYKNVEEGGTYEEEKEFQITLKNQADYIDEICINGELQKTNLKSKVYQYNVQEYKNYEISVKAYDKAGNETTSRIHFQVAAKKTILEKIVEPFVRKLVKSDEIKDESVQDKVTEGKGMIGGVILALILGSGSIIWWSVRRKNNQ